MAIYQSILDQLPELSNFYRYEGGLSYSYFHPNGDTAFSSNSYIYFSKSIHHHHYYVSKRIIQYLNEILSQYHKKLNYYSFSNPRQFNQILDILFHSPMDEFISIQCSTSPLMNTLLYKNGILNSRKNGQKHYIELCDLKKYQGGYGFCDEWLDIFNTLTYFYSFLTITKDDVVNFLINQKARMFYPDSKVLPTAFLENKQRCVKINISLFNDWKKYDLMNSMQQIIEKGLYCEQSNFRIDSHNEMKRVLTQYMKERKRILSLTEHAFEQNISL